MLKNLLNISNKRFCLNNRLKRIYNTALQIKDITLIKGINQDIRHVKIQDQIIQLPVQKLIFDLNFSRKQGDSFIQIYDQDMNMYHPTTPLAIVVQQPFFIKRQGKIYSVLNNIPLINKSQSQQFSNFQCSSIVQKVCKQSIDDLKQLVKQGNTGTSVHNLIMNNLLKSSMNSKIQKTRYKQLLKVTNKLIQMFDLQIKQVEQITKKKANRSIKYYTNFLIAQYIVIHYYIYNHLSWDIMQPITVILANIDILVGYLFFIIKGRDWSYQQIHGSYVDQRKYAYLKKHGINIQKYSQLLKIRQYLQFRLKLLSKNPYDIMETLQKKIQILDTR